MAVIAALTAVKACQSENDNPSDVCGFPKAGSRLDLYLWMFTIVWNSAYKAVTEEQDSPLLVDTVLLKYEASVSIHAIKGSTPPTGEELHLPSRAASSSSSVLHIEMIGSRLHTSPIGRRSAY